MKNKPKKSRLEQIKEGRACKKLPNTATKKEIEEAHLIKMTAKKIFRARLYTQLAGPAFVPANLSVNHPDYGMKWLEHTTEKDKRSHVL